ERRGHRGRSLRDVGPRVRDARAVDVREARLAVVHADARRARGRAEAGRADPAPLGRVPPAPNPLAGIPPPNPGPGRGARAPAGIEHARDAPLHALQVTGREERELHRVLGRATVFPRAAIFARVEALLLIAVEAADEIGREAELLVLVAQVDR